MRCSPMIDQFAAVVFVKRGLAQTLGIQNNEKTRTGKNFRHYIASKYDSDIFYCAFL